MPPHVRKALPAILLSGAIAGAVAVASAERQTHVGGVFDAPVCDSGEVSLSRIEQAILDAARIRRDGTRTLRAPDGHADALVAFCPEDLPKMPEELKRALAREHAPAFTAP